MRRAHTRGGSVARATRGLVFGTPAEDVARRIRRGGFDLVLAVGGFHERLDVLAALREQPGRPPLAAWVGDAFDLAAAPLAELYDLVGHTDTALLGRHQALGFRAPAIYLPHAADPSRRAPRAPRSDRMVFIGAASPEREAVLARLRYPVDVYGPGWKGGARRVSHQATGHLYVRALAALNIRNAVNVVAGLNQRNFDPYLFGAPVVSDDQPDLARCFEIGAEVLVWGSPENLGEAYARLRREPATARRLAEAGLKRILSQHTFEHRLASVMGAL